MSWRGWPSRCSAFAPTPMSHSSSTTASAWPSGSAPTASISASRDGDAARGARDPRPGEADRRHLPRQPPPGDGGGRGGRRLCRVRRLLRDHDQAERASARSGDPELVGDRCSKFPASRSAGSRPPMPRRWSTPAPTSSRSARRCGARTTRPAKSPSSRRCSRRRWNGEETTVRCDRVAGRIISFRRACDRVAPFTSSSPLRRWPRLLASPTAQTPATSAAQRRRAWVAPGTPGSPIDGTVFHAQVLLERGRFLDRA